jgi:hypothetical protein
MNQSTKLIQNRSKEIKSDNFCYRKVGRAITKWGAIEKSPILLSQYWKIYHFLRVTKIISHFDDSNNIFVDCSFGDDDILDFHPVLNEDIYQSNCRESQPETK